MDIVHSSIQVRKSKLAVELLYYEGYIRYTFILHAEKFSCLGLRGKQVGVIMLYGEVSLLYATDKCFQKENTG
jgi:hypothetical protein